MRRLRRRIRAPLLDIILDINKLVVHQHVASILVFSGIVPRLGTLPLLLLLLLLLLIVLGSTMVGSLARIDYGMSHAI